MSNEQKLELDNLQIVSEKSSRFTHTLTAIFKREVDGVVLQRYVTMGLNFDSLSKDDAISVYEDIIHNVNRSLNTAPSTNDVVK